MSAPREEVQKSSNFAGKQYRVRQVVVHLGCVEVVLTYYLPHRIRECLLKIGHPNFGRHMCIPLQDDADGFRPRLELGHGGDVRRAPHLQEARRLAAAVRQRTGTS